MATRTQVETALDTLVADAAIARAIIQGAADDPDVMTENGLVPPLAKKIAQMEFPDYADVEAANVAMGGTGRVFHDTTLDVHRVTTADA